MSIPMTKRNETIFRIGQLMSEAIMVDLNDAEAMLRENVGPDFYKEAQLAVIEFCRAMREVDKRRGHAAATNKAELAIRTGNVKGSA